MTNVEEFRFIAAQMTTAWIQALSQRYGEDGYSDGAANYEATRLGVEATHMLIDRLSDVAGEGE